MAKALPLTKVVQNDAYAAPALPSSVRTKALTSMSRTLVNKEDSPKELPPAEVRRRGRGRGRGGSDRTSGESARAGWAGGCP